MTLSDGDFRARQTTSDAVEVDMDDEQPDCNPPAVHIFLDGRWRCECGAIDYSMIVDVITGETVLEALLA